MRVPNHSSTWFPVAGASHSQRPRFLATTRSFHQGLSALGSLTWTRSASKLTPVWVAWDLVMIRGIFICSDLRSYLTELSPALPDPLHPAPHRCSVYLTCSVALELTTVDHIMLCNKNGKTRSCPGGGWRAYQKFTKHCSMLRLPRQLQASNAQHRSAFGHLRNSPGIVPLPVPRQHRVINSHTPVWW